MYPLQCVWKSNDVSLDFKFFFCYLDAFINKKHFELSSLSQSQTHPNSRGGTGELNFLIYISYLLLIK